MPGSIPWSSRAPDGSSGHQRPAGGRSDDPPARRLGLSPWSDDTARSYIRVANAFRSRTVRDQSLTQTIDAATRYAGVGVPSGAARAADPSGHSRCCSPAAADKLRLEIGDTRATGLALRITPLVSAAKCRPALVSSAVSSAVGKPGLAVHRGGPRLPRFLYSSDEGIPTKTQNRCVQ
jgi:hypothetical protein